MLVAGLVLTTLYVLAAIFAPLIAPYGFSQLRDENGPFGAQQPPSPEHLFGTTVGGYDVLSRVIWGTQTGLGVIVVAVLLSIFAGVALGLVSGYFGGWLDRVVVVICDAIYAFPTLLLAIVIVAVLGPSLTNAMIAISLVVLPHYTRLTRAAVITELSKDYVVASKVSGAGVLRQMFITVLPNCTAPLIVQATLSFSNAILDAAALGFLGMGAQAPTPEWGTMLAEAREFILTHWWIVTFPGLAILITVLAINLMGDGLRDALDPKLKRS